MTGCPDAPLRIRVGSVVHTSGLAPGLVAHGLIRVVPPVGALRVLPRLRQDAASGVGNHDDMADATLGLGGQEHITGSKTTGGVQVRVSPGDLLKTPRLHPGA